MAGVLLASAQDAQYQLDPAQSSVKFTLGDVLHTLRGTFKVKQGNLQIESNGKVSGQIVVDAASGESGSGTVANSGRSSVVLHGMFNIHGADREISVPAQVEMTGEQWTATVHFSVPYQKWGMKNPSTLFLRVSDSVEIDLVATGTVTRHTARSAQ